MTATETTPAEQSEAISFEFDLAHSPAKVWRALTDPALLSQWLLPVVDIELARGAAFTLQAPPQGGWDGRVNGRFLDIEPERKLTYAWMVGDLDTVVTFVLTPTTRGTHLSLVHSGFKPAQKRNFGGARYGWRLMAGRLVDLLATTG